MKTPLLALLPWAVLGWAAAAPQGADPAGAAFMQDFSQTVEATAAAFRDDRVMPRLKIPADPAVVISFSGPIENYSILTAQLTYIQAGRDPGDTPEAFAAMIRHMSAKILVDPDAAVALYGGRVRPAEGVSGDKVSEPALRAGLMAEMINSRRLPPQMEKEIAGKLDRMRQSLLRILRDEGVGASVSAVERNWVSQQYRDPKDIKTILPQVQPGSLKIADPPAAPAPMTLKSESIFAYLDWDKAQRLAQEAVDGAKRFVGRCYAYAKKAMDDVLPEGWRSQVGGASAYQFASSINRNPKLFDKLKLRKIDTNTLPDGIPPVGSIIVYGRGMCGFSREHGHIEIVVGTTPPRACSDGCMSITPSRLQCIKKYSSRNWVNVYVPVRSTPVQ